MASLNGCGALGEIALASELWLFLHAEDGGLSSEFWACKVSLKSSKSQWPKFFPLYKKDVWYLFLGPQSGAS